MASQINASNSGFGGIVSTGDSSGVLQLQTTGTTAVTIDTSQNVGIGTSSPASKFHVSGNAIASNVYFGNTTSSAGTISSDSSLTGAQILLYGTSSPSPGTVVIASTSTGSISLSTNGVTKCSIDSSGNFAIIQTPGKYTVDTSGGATSIANNGTVDYANASGMLVVNNHTSGSVTIYLCGAGTTGVVSTLGTQVGTFAYVSGIGGYRWTNNYGSTATFGFFFVRTRQTA